jgi:hypothetical protein
LPLLNEPHQDRLLKEELNLYTNLAQSYQKKYESLQSEVVSLELKQRQKAKETEQVDA